MAKTKTPTREKSTPTVAPEAELQQIEQELNQLPFDVRDAIRAGDEELLVRLSARRSILEHRATTCRSALVDASIAEVQAEIDVLSPRIEAKDSECYELKERAGEAERALSAAIRDLESMYGTMGLLVERRQKLEKQSGEVDAKTAESVGAVAGVKPGGWWGEVSA